MHTFGIDTILAQLSCIVSCAQHNIRLTPFLSTNCLKRLSFPCTFLATFIDSSLCFIFFGKYCCIIKKWLNRYKITIKFQLRGFQFDKYTKMVFNQTCLKLTIIFLKEQPIRVLVGAFHRFYNYNDCKRLIEAMLKAIRTM